MSPITDTVVVTERPIRRAGFPRLDSGFSWAPILLSSVVCAVWFELAFIRGARPVMAVAAGVLFFGAALGLFGTVTEFLSRMAKTMAAREQFRRTLSRCSYASLVFLIFMPEYVARLRPTLLRSSLLIAVVFGLWVALVAMCMRAHSSAEREHQRPRHPLIVGGVCLLLLFTAVTVIAIRKYEVFGYVGQDLAYFAQLTYNTLRGHLFAGNLLQDLLYTKSVATDFAGHNSPVMFLFVPFYAVFPSPITLIVLRNIAILLCAIPVYLTARSYLKPGVSCLWAAAFLLTPAVLYQTTFDFYPLSFAALPALFAIYFYLKERYVWFLVALLGTLVVREDLAFFAIGLGLVALAARRSVRWYLTPLAAGIVWAAVSFLVVIPTALHGATFVTDACFRHLGSSTAAIVRHVVLHPLVLLSRGNVLYLKVLLTPTALVAALPNPLALLSLPFVGINLLAGDGPCITTVIFAQYSLVPATLLFAATLASAITRPAAPLMKLLRLGLPYAAAAPALLIALSCASLIFVTGKPQFDELKENPWNPEARSLLRLVPAGATVAAPRYLLPHLANRECLFQTHRLEDYHMAKFEYLILDLKWDHINASQQYASQYRRLLATAPSNPKYERLYSSPNFLVLRDPSAQQQSCIAGQSGAPVVATQP